MAEVFLNCPQCQRQLRVTDNLVGRPVKCPACGFTFSVAPGSSEPQALPAVPATPSTPAPAQPGQEPYGYERFPEIPRRGDWEQEEVDPRRARALVLPPALCLLISTCLGLLGDIIYALLFALAPEALMKEVEQFKIGNAPPLAPTVFVVVHLFFAGLCVIIILASIQMLRLRMYPLAIIGCFLAMINCGSNCCILGIPFGIWGLVMLFRPEVRDAFQ